MYFIKKNEPISILQGTLIRSAFSNLQKCLQDYTAFTSYKLPNGLVNTYKGNVKKNNWAFSKIRNPIYACLTTKIILQMGFIIILSTYKLLLMTTKI